MRCAAVIPAYNEAGTVREVVEQARRHVDLVLLVDDGSTDGTAGRVRDLEVRVLRNARNRGKSAALLRGIDAALAAGVDAVVTLDADGQHRPDIIPDLLRAAREHPRAVIVASRTRARDRVPPLRDFANRCANFWISWAAGHDIADTQSGFRLYPAGLFRAIRLRDDTAGFVLESEILIEAARAGYPSVAVDIEAIYGPAMRRSYYRPWADTLRIVRMVAWKLLSRGLYLHGLIRYLGQRRHRDWQGSRT